MIDENTLHCKNTVKDDGTEFTVETYELSIPHGPDRRQHYESLVDGMVHDRYETEGEAVEGHERLLARLNNGEYHFEVVEERLVIEDE